MISLKNLTKPLGREREFLRVLLTQIYFTFNQSVPLVTTLGLGTGLALSFQAKLGLSFIGGNNNLGQLIIFILFREVAPLITSLVIITRSVTAVTSELATMKVGREIDALEMMGINIPKYLLAPRLWAGNISLFLMAITFTYFSILGAWIGANFSSYFPLSQFMASMANAISPWDFVFFFLKTNLIGHAVFKIGCQRGLSLKGASYEVPIVTNSAVVDSLFAAISLQAIISVAFYLFQGFHI